MVKFLFNAKSEQSAVEQLESVLRQAEEVGDVALDLSTNALSKLEQSELLQMIGRLHEKNIQSVNLAATKLHLKPTVELLALLAAFENTQVTSLNLSANWLGVIKNTQDLLAIIEGLKLTNIMTINLSNNALGCLGVENFTQVLDALEASRLTTVELSDNELDRLGGAHYIAELMFAHLKEKVFFRETNRFISIVVEHMQVLTIAATQDVSTEFSSKEISGMK